MAEWKPISGQVAYHTMPSKHDTSTQCQFNAGTPSPALAINHQYWTVLSVGGSVSTEYKLTLIQCLVNVGPASPALASIHSALVSTSCWRKFVHIVYTAPMPFKWTDIGLMYVTPTHCRVNGRLVLHRLCQHIALKQSWVDVGPTSVTLAHIQHAAKHDTVRNLIYIITTTHQTLSLQQRI